MEAKRESDVGPFNEAKGTMRRLPTVSKNDLDASFFDMKTLFLAAALGAFSLFAKPVHAPLPPEAYVAKTIAIINHTGKQGFTDKAYDELQKWGRFTVVSDPTKAELVLVIDTERHTVGATANTYGNGTYVTANRVLDVTVSFFLNAHQEPFFAETERAIAFRKSATKRGIDQLRKRIDEGQGDIQR